MNSVSAQLTKRTQQIKEGFSTAKRNLSSAEISLDKAQQALQGFRDKIGSSVSLSAALKNPTLKRQHDNLVQTLEGAKSRYSSARVKMSEARARMGEVSLVDAFNKIETPHTVFMAKRKLAHRAQKPLGFLNRIFGARPKVQILSRDGHSFRHVEYPDGRVKVTALSPQGKAILKQNDGVANNITLHTQSGKPIVVERRKVQVLSRDGIKFKHTVYPDGTETLLPANQNAGGLIRILGYQGKSMRFLNSKGNPVTIQVGSRFFNPQANPSVQKAVGFKAQANQIIDDFAEKASYTPIGQAAVRQTSAQLDNLVAQGNKLTQVAKSNMDKAAARVNALSQRPGSQKALAIAKRKLEQTKAVYESTVAHTKGLSQQASRFKASIKDGSFKARAKELASTQTVINASRKAYEKSVAEFNRAAANPNNKNLAKLKAHVDNTKAKYQNAVAYGARLREQLGSVNLREGATNFGQALRERAGSFNLKEQADNFGRALRDKAGKRFRKDTPATPALVTTPHGRVNPEALKRLEKLDPNLNPKPKDGFDIDRSPINPEALKTLEKLDPNLNPKPKDGFDRSPTTPPATPVVNPTPLRQVETKGTTPPATPTLVTTPHGRVNPEALKRLEKLDPNLNPKPKDGFDRSPTTPPATPTLLKPHQVHSLKSVGVKFTSNEGIPIGGQDLRNINFNRMDLSGVSFVRVRISKAQDTNFRGATLRDNDFRGADLSDAKFNNADLRGSDLRGVDLTGTILTKADLRGVDLRGAKFDMTQLRFAKYDANTRFPAGFDPKKAGMVLDDAPTPSPAATASTPTPPATPAVNPTPLRQVETKGTTPPATPLVAPVSGGNNFFPQVRATNKQAQRGGVFSRFFQRKKQNVSEHQINSQTSVLVTEPVPQTTKQQVSGFVNSVSAQLTKRTQQIKEGFSTAKRNLSSAEISLDKAQQALQGFRDKVGSSVSLSAALKNPTLKRQHDNLVQTLEGAKSRYSSARVKMSEARARMGEVSLVDAFNKIETPHTVFMAKRKLAHRAQKPLGFLNRIFGARPKVQILSRDGHSFRHVEYPDGRVKVTALSPQGKAILKQNDGVANNITLHTQSGKPIVVERRKVQVLSRDGIKFKHTVYPDGTETLLPANQNAGGLIRILGYQGKSMRFLNSKGNPVTIQVGSRFFNPQANPSVQKAVGFKAQANQIIDDFAEKASYTPIGQAAVRQTSAQLDNLVAQGNKLTQDVRSNMDKAAAIVNTLSQRPGSQKALAIAKRKLEQTKAVYESTVAHTKGLSQQASRFKASIKDGSFKARAKELASTQTVINASRKAYEKSVAEFNRAAANPNNKNLAKLKAQAEGAFSKYQNAVAYGARLREQLGSVNLREGATNFGQALRERAGSFNLKEQADNFGRALRDKAGKRFRKDTPATPTLVTTPHGRVNPEALKRLEKLDPNLTLVPNSTTNLLTKAQKHRTQVALDRIIKDKNIDLRDLDLTVVNLARRFLHGIKVKNARGAWFNDSDLRGSDFRGSDLTYASLRKADLSDAKFNNADVRGVDFTGAKFENTHFTGAKYNKNTRFPAGFDPKKAGMVLDDAPAPLPVATVSTPTPPATPVVSPTPLRQVETKGTTPPATNAKPIRVYKTNYARADLRGKDFRGDDLDGIIFTDADLRGADFRGADFRGSTLTGAKLTGAKYNANTRFPAGFDPKKAGMVLDDAPTPSPVATASQAEAIDMAKVLNRPEFQSLGSPALRIEAFKKLLLGAKDLRNANLPGINLTGTKFNGRDLSGIKINMGNLTRTDLRNVNFTDAELTMTIFNGADARGAIFNGADLRRSADLPYADLRGAKYNKTTRFPDGFDPKQEGMILVDDVAPSPAATASTPTPPAAPLVAPVSGGNNFFPQVRATNKQAQRGGLFSFFKKKESPPSRDLSGPTNKQVQRGSVSSLDGLVKDAPHVVDEFKTHPTRGFASRKVLLGTLAAGGVVAYFVKIDDPNHVQPTVLYRGQAKFRVIKQPDGKSLIKPVNPEAEELLRQNRGEKISLSDRIGRSFAIQVSP